MDRQEKYRGGHLSPERIKRYLQNELSNTEMHEVELHLLDCDACSDAVEGFELSAQNSINTEHTLHDLRNQLANRIKNHETHRKLARWPAWSAAAGIALAIAGYVVIKYMELEEQKLPETMVERIIAQLDVDNSDTLMIFIPKTDELMAYNDSEIPTVTQSQGFAKRKPSASTEMATEPAKIVGKVLGRNAKSAQQVSQDSVYVTSYSPKRKQSIASSATTIKSLDSFEKGFKMEQNNPKTVLKGRVVSKDGEALPGVALSIVETNEGTTTDVNGSFKLVTSADTANIRISYIGFKSETFQLNDSTQLAKIVLEPDQQALDQVVVVGYGQAISREATPRVNAADYDRYLKENLIYPQKALENKVEGTVRVRFTVTKDAGLTHFNVLKSLGYGCDEEAIRLIKEGPKWNPALDKGQTKRQRVTRTVTFSLPSSQ